MDNRRKLLMLGTLTLSLLWQGKLVNAQGEIYSPNDPTQQVVPTEAQARPAPSVPVSEISVPDTETKAAAAKPETNQTAPSKATDPLKEVRPKGKKLFLDDTFFAKIEKQKPILRTPHPGGEGGIPMYDIQLIMTLKILTGIAVYGRRG